MRARIWFVVVVAIAIAILIFVMKRRATQETRESMNTTHIILIGASIGQGWHLAEWPGRAKVNGYTAESIPAWQFDKTEAVDEVLMRPRRKFRPTRTYLKSLFQPPPEKASIVILKECSSYFPGDLAVYKSSIQHWVSRLREKQITVVLATVVPVTETRAQQSPGKQEGLVEYNKWIRQSAQQQGVILLDLEAALRTAGTGQFLREEYAASDGTHLNATAYTVLDKFLRETLLETKSLQAASIAR